MKVKKFILFIAMMMAFMFVATAAAPSVSLISPSANALVRNQTVTLTYSVSSTNISTNTTSCQLYTVDGGQLFSDSVSTNATGVPVTVSHQYTFASDNQAHNWYVTCTDMVATTTPQQTFTIAVAPAVSSSLPSQPTVNTPYSIFISTSGSSDSGITFTKVNGPTDLFVASNGQVTWNTPVLGQTSFTVRAIYNANPTVYTERTYTLNPITDSKLRIQSVNLKIAGNDNIISSNFGEVTDSDAIMGAKLGLDVTIRNDQPSGQNIEKVEGTATFKDLDGGNDVEGTVSRFTLDGGTNEEKSFKLDMSTIPYTAEYKRYSVKVEVKGKNETNGVSMSDTWTIYMTVRKDTDPNIKISHLSTFPTEVSCERDFSLDVKGVNIGDNDDNVVLKVESPQLKIYELKEFEMGDNPSDDCNAIDDPTGGCFLFEKSFSYTAASSMAAGTYPITVTTYYGTTKQTDKQTVNLKVSKCEEPIAQPVQAPTQQPVQAPTQQTPQVVQNTTPIVVVQAPTTPVNTIAGSTPIKIAEKTSLADNKYYVALLVLANIGLLAIIFGVLKQAFAKKY